MLTTFTGLEMQASAALLSSVAAGAKVRQSSAYAVVNSPRLGQFGRVVWLYRSPWALVGRQGKTSESVAQELVQWLDVHRALLRKRRALGKQLLLVNADGVDPAALLSSLELPVAAEPTMVATPNQDGECDPAVTVILAQVFESVAPEYSDVFHALEALSWLGQEGHTGQEHAALTDDAVLQVFQMLADSQAVPGLRAALSAAQAEACKQAAAATDAAMALTKAQAAEKAAVAKAASAEKFAAHVSQRLEVELAQAKQQVVTAQAQAQMTAAEQGAREQAELEKLKTELAQAKQQAAAAQAQVQKTVAEQRAREQAEVAKVQAELKGLQSENELLLLQMHQVQEDLERYFLENRQLQQVIAESHGSLDRARKVISGFMKGAAAKSSPAPAPHGVVAEGVA